MRWFIRLVFLLVLFVPIAFVGIAFMCVESSPRVYSEIVLSAENLDRVRALLYAHDPRTLRGGEVRTVRMTEEELELVLLHAINRVGTGGVALDLDPGLLNISASVDLSKVLPGRYLNVDTVLSSEGSAPRVDRLTIGRVSVPQIVIRIVESAVNVRLSKAIRVESLADIIQAVDIRAQRLDVTYRWEEGIADAVRAHIVSADDREAMRAYNRFLSFEVVRHSTDRSFKSLLEAFFNEVRKRSVEADAVAENRAALVVLAAYVNGRSLKSLIPEAKTWAKPRPIRFQLHRRSDFVQHFATSAALAATGGGAIADAIGLSKEIDDADGGSGFSFKDLAADKAGKRFGEVAVWSTASAERLQRLVADGTDEQTLLPNVDGLEERLSEAEFERNYGGLAGDSYKLVVNDIEARISSSPLYR